MLRALLIVALSCAPVAAEDDEELRRYLSKSPLVITGEIAAEPNQTIHWGEVSDLFQVKDIKVIKGEMPEPPPKTDPKKLPPDLAGILMRLPTKESKIVFGVVVWRIENERPEFLKKGQRVILFLREGGQTKYDFWREADPWFGVQPYSETLERDLERLAQEKTRGPIEQ